MERKHRLYPSQTKVIKIFFITAIMMGVFKNVSAKPKEVTNTNIPPCIPEHLSQYQADLYEPPIQCADMGACPFEGCIYREWIAKKIVILLDKPNGTRAIVTLQPGDKVKAITGLVIVIPIRKVLVQDHNGMKTGDKIFGLANAGEGAIRWWSRGKFIDEEPGSWTKQQPMNPSSLKTPILPLSEDWWVQIRTSNGKIGWVNEGHAPDWKNDFDGTDSLG